MAFISYKAPTSRITWVFTPALMRALATAIQALLDTRTRRVARASMAKLSERALRDIGLTPLDVTQIAHDPHYMHAASDLARVAHRQSLNW